MTTDMREKGLEDQCVAWLVETNGYELGTTEDYNRKLALDETRMMRFLEDTQGAELDRALGEPHDETKKRKLLERVASEIAKRGVVDVLRKGVDFHPARFTLFYLPGSVRNEAARMLCARNVFSVVRQLKYAVARGRENLALDLALFINGIPVVTCELKNLITRQNVNDAVEQYKTDRNPNEPLFRFKRCMAHFAVDDAEARFCTKLEGPKSWFLPFNRGYLDGAGNPPVPGGMRTEYLWREVFAKDSLADIIGNFAQVAKEKDQRTGRETEKQVFPRYHQLDAVRKLLASVRTEGVGRRYLVQHSTGSGKSNSIAWLAHQLAAMQDAQGDNVVASVVVVTDRVNLDRQIRDTIRQFTQVGSAVGWATASGQLAQFLAGGKRIIVTTIQKFPFILNDIGDAHRGRRFAIIIDEAHSSQSGSLSLSMNQALQPGHPDEDSGDEEEEDPEDIVQRIIESRPLLKNASYFAFTATPKNKTLEMFGEAYPSEEQPGETAHRPFHVYTMKQAIQEGFILDVLQNYTSCASYFKLYKAVEDDPLYDSKRARKKLVAFVQGSDITIERKAEIIVDHFINAVVNKGKIAGKAKAMVVTGGIERAIKMHRAIAFELRQRRSPCQALVAFSGEKEMDGRTFTESSINGFESRLIPSRLREDDTCRFLVVADKFQTGYDEPLLHTMYVDKILSDIKAVQTLSRLNRAHPNKTDTFVLDFANDPQQIVDAFSRYYRTTLLSAEMDPNKLHDLRRVLEESQVFGPADVEDAVAKMLTNEPRPEIDGILDACVERFVLLKHEETEDAQYKFKGAAKAYIRSYAFLAAVNPLGNPYLEKLSIFLSKLVPKLPNLGPDDPMTDLLNAVDLDSIRIEKQIARSLQPEDENGVVNPVPVDLVAGRHDREYDPLSVIIEEFNKLFGDIDWKDVDNVVRQIRAIPEMVARHESYRNAVLNSGPENARREGTTVLQDIIVSIMTDNLELYKQFSENDKFRAWLSEKVLAESYAKAKHSFGAQGGSA